MKEKKFQLRMPRALLELLQKSAAKNMRSLNSEIVVLVRDRSYYYVHNIAPKKESWISTIRMPLELNAELTETARHVGHSMNIEIISRIAFGLGVTRLSENTEVKS